MGHNPFPNSNLDDPDYHDHSNNLRAKVEALLDRPDARLIRTGHAYRKAVKDAAALIPEGDGEWATEETLAAAMHHEWCNGYHDIDLRPCESLAAAIIAKLREGTE